MNIYIYDNLKALKYVLDASFDLFTQNTRFDLLTQCL